MRIYLASRYSRRLELLGYAADLKSLGHEITSRWLDGNHQVDDRGLSVESERSERERFAREDWDDVKAADWVISFSEVSRSSNSRGGRHVEHGMALAWGKRCVVIGPAENIFHCLVPEVERFETWQEFLAGRKEKIDA